MAAGTLPFWEQVEVGARQAGKELGLNVHFRGPNHEGRVTTQLEMINWMLEQGCKALVIAPSGPEIAPRVQQLAGSGINTVYFGRDLPGSAVQCAAWLPPITSTLAYRLARHWRRRSEGRVRWLCCACKPACPLPASVSVVFVRARSRAA